MSIDYNVKTIIFCKAALQWFVSWKALYKYMWVELNWMDYWVIMFLCMYTTIQKSRVGQLFQCSVSHDPSGIILICWFGSQATYLTIIRVENNVFVETLIRFLHGYLLIWKLEKNSIYLKLKYFVTQMSLLSLLINLTFPCLIQIFIY